MNIQQALLDLGVADDAFSLAQRQTLDSDGFVLLRHVFTPEQCGQAAAEFDRLSALEGEQGGREVHTERGARRVSNIFNKSTAFDFCLTCRLLLAAAYYLLGDFKVHGANLREPLPGHGDQDLHIDEGRDSRTDWRVLNALILFDVMTRDNGGTRLVPGSHRWPVTPRRGQALPDGVSAADLARIPADPHAPYPGEIYPTPTSGSIVAINAML